MHCLRLAAQAICESAGVTEHLLPAVIIALLGGIHESGAHLVRAEVRVFVSCGAVSEFAGTFARHSSESRGSASQPFLGDPGQEATGKVVFPGARWPFA